VGNGGTSRWWFQIKEKGVGLYKAKLWAIQVFRLAKGKFTVDTFIQYQRAVQPFTVIPRLAKSPFGHQTACTDRHLASEKQPAKADHLIVAFSEYKI